MASDLTVVSFTSHEEDSGSQKSSPLDVSYPPLQAAPTAIDDTELRSNYFERDEGWEDLEDRWEVAPSSNDVDPNPEIRPAQHRIVDWLRENESSSVEQIPDLLSDMVGEVATTQPTSRNLLQLTELTEPSKTETPEETKSTSTIGISSCPHADSRNRRNSPSVYKSKGSVACSPGRPFTPANLLNNDPQS